MPSGSRDLAHLGEMGVQLAAGLVDGLDRRARELELAARLERDRAAAGHVDQADDVAVVEDRLPAEQPACPRAAPGCRAALIGDRARGRRARTGISRARCRCGTAPSASALLEPRDELVARLDRRHVDLVTGHL